MLLRRIYSIHLLLAIFFFTAGCGVSGSKNTNTAPVFTINAAMKTTQDISTLERNIASNICLALKSKSQNYKTSDFLGSRFIFQTKQKTCGVAGAVANITTALSLRDDGTFHYASNSSGYNDFAQTDVSGYLSQICSKINNNLPISNTTTLYGVTVQIVFFKDFFEGYTIQYFSKISDGTSQTTSVMTSAETFKIRTQVNYVVGNVMGMDEYYSKETICPTDATKTSLEEQIFLSR